MPIHLSITADDPDVQELLFYIRSRFSHLDTENQRQVAERAAKWLTVMDWQLLGAESMTSELELDRDPVCPALSVQQ